jgi:peptide-methionine (S)-S-oxide reductase
MEKAIFAAGCFWGVEEAFYKTGGVIDTRVGYTGGHTDNPTYKQVCSGKTGHAEAVEVTYDPKKIQYNELLNTFWSIHDPTQVNRQGPDYGEQYRSAIFYLSEQQKKEALASKEALERLGKMDKPIATEITAASEFYPAEDYHQKYFQKHKGMACLSHIVKKL